MNGEEFELCDIPGQDLLIREWGGNTEGLPILHKGRYTSICRAMNRYSSGRTVGTEDSYGALDLNTAGEF
jgi:hypothetical protein